jgi:hypothetical protein
MGVAPKVTPGARQIEKQATEWRVEGLGTEMSIEV